MAVTHYELYMCMMGWSVISSDVKVRIVASGLRSINQAKQVAREDAAPSRLKFAAENGILVGRFVGKAKNVDA